MAHVSVFYRWRLLGSLRDIAKGVGPIPEIAKDLFKPGGLRRFAYVIRHYIRLRFMRNRYNEPFLCGCHYAKLHFVGPRGALEQKWRKTDAKVLMECADELRAILGKEQPKQ